MISIPIAVYNSHFEWQLDLFWYGHTRLYRDEAKKMALACVIKRNTEREPICEKMEWKTNIPYILCDSYFDHPLRLPSDGYLMPSNIQIGLLQAMSGLSDGDVIEVLDCDMVHLRPHPAMEVGDDELLVSDIYENWHLHSKSTNKHVIETYFRNGGFSYNGGFVPIVGKVKTFRKIMVEWISIHKDIVRRFPEDKSIKWWAGMYSLQACCEMNKVCMTPTDFCYFPGINRLSENHYIAHYSCDRAFDKKKYPKVDKSSFESNLFYDTVRSWMMSRESQI